MDKLKKIIKMLKRKTTFFDRISYLKDMSKLLTALNIAVAQKIILLDRSGLNKAIDQLDLILKKSIKKREVNNV